jgi:hypothetical protein
MKKIILNTLAFCAFSISCFSQDGIAIKYNGDNVDYSVSNGVAHSPLVVTTNTAGETILDFTIENTTGSNVAWRIQRLSSNTIPSTWIDAECFGVDCFAPHPEINPWCSPTGHELNIANGQTGSFVLHVSADVYGTGNYKFYITNDCSTMLDSMTIEFSYTTGVKELKQTPSFSMFPNPSDEHVSILMNNTDKGLVKIVDLLGNVIYSETIVTSSKINTSEFKNGVYFVTIESEGLKLASRKLVVRH